MARRFGMMALGEGVVISQGVFVSFVLFNLLLLACLLGELFFFLQPCVRRSLFSSPFSDTFFDCHDERHMEGATVDVEFVT